MTRIPLACFLAIIIPLACFAFALGQGKDDSGSSPKKEPAAADNGAKKKPAKKPDEGTNRVKMPMPGITLEREAAVMTFVRTHHPALEELLVRLRQGAPAEYERAVRDLLRTSERLAMIQERDADRYETSLALWKVQSRIHLLTARLSMKRDGAIEQELKQALREQLELERQDLKLERERLTTRLKRLEEQLSNMETNGDSLTEARYRAITGAIKPLEKKPVNPPGKKPKPSETPASVPQSE